MSDTKQPDLLTGSITAHIIRLSLPMIVAMLFQTGFSVIDMVFVGMVSPEAMAVLSIVFPVIFFFVSFAMGIGAGLTSFIARAFGAGDLEKAGHIAANGLAFSVVISVPLAVSGILFAKPLFLMLGAGPDILDSVLDYCRISVFMISVAAIALLFAGPLNTIFTRDARVIALGTSFLFYRAPFWALMGVRIMIGAGFNGAGKPRVGLLTLLFGLFIIGLPATFILKSLMGLNAVWAGLSIANIAGAAAAYIVYRRSFAQRVNPASIPS